MCALSFDPLAPAQLATIENPQAKLAIEKKTGFIRSMLFKKTKVDLFAQCRGGIPGYIGGIRIYDELDRVWYSDLTTGFKVAAFKQQGQTVSFTRQYDGAPFKITVTLAMNRDGLDRTSVV